MDATPRGITEQLEGLTSTEGQRLVSPYIGKWIKVSAPVVDVMAGTDSATAVVIGSIYEGDRIFLWFGADSMKRAELLRKGRRHYCERTH